MMRELIIDEEFRFLLPALDKRTYALLEERILENGVRDPIVIWGDTIIDGHNRYSIATQHDIPFTTVAMEFGSRDEATIWIISTQISRRNLTPMQLSYFRGIHYRADKGSYGDNGAYAKKRLEYQNDILTKSTAARLANQYKVSSATINRDAKFAVAVNSIGRSSPAAKVSILSGETKITRKQLKELMAGSDEDIEDTASRIVDGTFVKQKPEKAAPVEASGLDGSGNDWTDSMDAAVLAATGEFYSNLQRLVGSHDGAELKNAVRASIDILEGLHSRLA